MEFVVYPLAVMGFIFGISAYTRIKPLEEKVKILEEEIEELKG